MLHEHCMLGMNVKSKVFPSALALFLFWQIDQFHQPHTDTRTHAHETASFAWFHLQAVNILYLSLRSLCPCLYFMLHVFFLSLVWGYINRDVYPWRKSINISFHNCWKRKIDRREKKGAKTEVLGCNKRVATTEYRSKSRRKSGLAKPTLLQRLFKARVSQFSINGTNMEWGGNVVPPLSRQRR